MSYGPIRLLFVKDNAKPARRHAGGGDVRPSRNVRPTRSGEQLAGALTAPPDFFPYQRRILAPTAKKIAHGYSGVEGKARAQTFS